MHLVRDRQTIVDDHSELPDDVPLVASFHHSANELSFYYNKLYSVVPQPRTSMFQLREIDTGIPDFDEDRMAHWMREHDYEQAFVRTEYSSAKFEPRAGSYIHRPDQDVIRDTVAELLAQHAMQRRQSGGRIALRRWLDLDYCPRQNPTHHHPNEVRYFIDDGEVVDHTPDKMSFVEDNLRCDELYSYVREDLQGGISYPDEMVESVADVFDEFAWSVDFVRHAKTEDMWSDWYLTDMGLHGCYYHEENEEWVPISGGSRLEDLDLDEIMPDDPLIFDEPSIIRKI